MVKTIETNVDAGAGRDFECQLAMSDQFRLLTEFAEHAGWSWDEIAMALLELTDDYVAAMRTPLEPPVAHTRFAPKSNTRH
ncbi:hypothetical protein MZK49_22440 [Ensifer sesbaniae]|uniref:hypothetical protein n=1 Tax=Ensifer sesbaniae TaxID=1214071 RepID=UPI002000CC32|nr:hypothetical protein [Ensifer sesbaniae]